MIAELSMVLILVCNSPAFLRVEMDGLINDYVVRDWSRKDGRLDLQFQTGQGEMNFYNQAAKEMQRRGIQMQFTNRDAGCA